MSQTGVLNPNDTVTIYNPAAPPVKPAAGVLVKWVKTVKLSWNTNSFKAYFYKNVAFRLKFPKTYQHNVADGKKYPLYVFFHGVGEKGADIYDNDYQLYHGGAEHMAAVDDGRFDGFLLYIQSTTTSGFFGDAYYTIVKELIDKYFVPEIKVDINRIIVDGLSGGGSAAWEFVTKYPQLVAAVLPISANSVANVKTIPSLKFTPIWNFQGALDNNPDPSTSKYVRDSFLRAGANYKYTEFPDIGHGCWHMVWPMPEYYAYMLSAHKANPWPLTGRTEFCQNDPVSVTLGVTAGFDGYEWRKNAVLIAGATGNTVVVTSLGTYDCRIKRGTEWSPWSPTPVVIKIKGATTPPAITVSGLASRVLPSPDGKTTVSLQVPAGYTSYAWQRTDNATVLGTGNVLSNATVGSYKVQVKEPYGCASVFTNPFTVLNANATGGPAAPVNPSATATSKTSVNLKWSAGAATPGATNFEIYQASSSDGPYSLIQIVAANVLTYTVNNLVTKNTYYYKIRAINNSAGSPVAGPAIVTTLSDITAPSAPLNLRTGVTSQSAIELLWNASTDDVGVSNYDVYINNIKSYVLAGSKTSFTAFNLTAGQQYLFTVKARDAAGNISAFSNQVSAVAANGSGGGEPGGIPNIPGNLVAEPVSRTSVQLKWVDRSANETGFEVWGAGTISGTYTLLASTTANVNTYTNTGLVAGTPYYYKVKAKSLSGTSDFSNMAAGAPLSYSVLVNLNETLPQALPWNNFNSKPLAAVALSNLKNDSSQVSGINITLLDAWTGSGETGKVTGNNSGAYPDNVIKTGFREESSSTRRIKLSGLSASYKYNLVLFGSVVANDARITRFAAGGQTISLNATNNTSNKAQLSGVSPNAAGEIELTVAKETGSFGAYLNALVIQAYPVTGVPITPGNLIATPTGKGSVNLTWADRSDNETGFEIWRAASYNGTYTLISTTGANATTFANSGLSTGTGYYYKVRAIAGTGPSEFTSVAGANTFASQVYINFNQTTPASAPWNNLNSAPNAGFAITNLKNDVNGSSGINITMVDAWTGANELGKVTGNNSGVYPDNVIKTAYAEQSAASKRIRLTGLPASKKYNLIFFASTTASDARVTKYTAGGQTVSLNATNNTLNTVKIDALSPTATGELEITVAKDATSAYAYINAICVQVYDPVGIPAAPAALSVTGSSGNSISLKWMDKSSNETGFEVWRSNSYYGTYSLVAQPAANDTAYTDGGLAGSSRYYYKVRAKAAIGNSDYSEPVAGATTSYAVYVSFNRDMPAAAPWNNTNTAPYTGYIKANMINDKNASSGITLTVVDNFTGDNSFGKITGNNTGVYPDNVIRSAWFTDAGLTAKIKIDGLNKSLGYNFIFFGSRDGNGDALNRTTVYTIGSSTASLNATNNTTQTTAINNVAPDENGAVFITVAKGATSPFGYLNALVIQAFTSLDTVVSQPAYQRVVDLNKDSTKGGLVQLSAGALPLNANPVTSATAFPNPFVETINVKLSLEKEVSQLWLTVRDSKGNNLYTKNMGTVPRGESLHKLVIGNKLPSGVYYLQVTGMPGKGRAETIKLVK